ncbi:MAG: AAA family ATPase, partial [Actinomyces sp.]|nr:AAA family ATPase [Actinomyces sp.]
MSTSADQQTVDALRRSVASLEEKNERLSRALSTARGQLVQLNEKIHRSQQPPHTLVSVLAVDTAARQIDAMVGTKHMRLTVDSSVDLSTVAVGQLVRLNENMVVVGVDHFERTGTLTSVLEVLGADRVLVSLEGGAEQVLTLAGPLRHGSVRAGDSVMANLRAGQAIERVTRSDVEQLLTPQVPDVTYDDIGGLDQQLASVRDSIEMPLRHPQLYRDYGLRPPKGILLYGPPGSGKTLIAKAVANALSQTESGVRGHFLSIKGPELLNKFVGETERQIRAIFSRARALAATGIPVV